MSILRVGTRGSLLALAQAREVVRCLKKKNPGTTFQIKIIKTLGDEFQTVEIFKQNNTGIFTKEIEKRLLQNEIDIAIHSLKDVPTDLPPGLLFAAFPRRVDPRDVLISPNKSTLKSLPPKSVVATASPRRKRQILILRPDVRVVDIRGNLDTRIKRVLKQRDLDALVLARAGLLRLGKYLKNASPISAEDLLPAVGQGALGLEVRASDTRVQKIVGKLNHIPTAICVLAERAFLKKLQGGCRVPVGIRSKIQKNTLSLKARVFSTQSSRWIEAVFSGPKSKPEKIGEELAKKLLLLGAAKFLKEARKES